MVLFLFGAAEPGPVVEHVEFEGAATLEMDSENPCVGDTVSYHLKVLLEPGWDLQAPANLNFSEGFRPVRESVVLKRTAVKGGVQFDLVVPFIVVRIGRLKFAERKFDAAGPGGETGRVRAGKIVVTTGSMFASENEPEPGSPLGPLPVVERNWMLIWVLIILLVVAMAVLVTLVAMTRLKPAGERPGPPPLPPHVTAFRKLDSLAELGLEKKGLFARFYTTLSMILREYVGGRWEFDSMDMTTTELNEKMRSVKLEHFVYEKLTYLFADFDLVKFAKVVPTPDQASADLERVREFVIATMVRPPRPAGPPDGKPAVEGENDSKEPKRTAGGREGPEKRTAGGREGPE